VLLHTGLGAALPFLPDFNDQFALGFADAKAGLAPEAWDAFAAPSTFGAEFGGIPTVRSVDFGSGEMVVDDGFAQELPAGVHTRYPRDFAAILSHPTSKKAAAVRTRLAPHLERFASFFERDFFLRRALETLNAEHKPEHAGWRKALAVVYDAFRSEVDVDAASFTDAEHGVPASLEPSCDEYCYLDEFFTSLDYDKVERLFAWLGFVKGPKMAEVCPICCEEKLTVEVLDHWEAAGDISDHKMCADCRRRNDKNECPFCKEVMLSVRTHAARVWRERLALSARPLF
jgi:hypothetical protein